MANRGRVYIAGVGPGDYRLITLKARQCIGKADVVVYDRLIDARILKFAREDAELIDVGKMPGSHSIPQEEINEILAEKALSGKTVARVKGGDPFLFGRGGEEAEYLAGNGIDFEIVPGVTSAIAVPAYAGIPVTHRDYCSSLHIITGHERPDKENSLIDYEVLAQLNGTLVFLMGIKNLPEICRNLIQHGKNRLTPAAVVENGTTQAQRVVTGVLKDIADKASAALIKPPAVTVIGDVVNLKDRLSWFPKGRLTGKRIVVTRSREQSGSFVEKIEELGGEAVEFPTIIIKKPDDFSRFAGVLAGVKSFDWLVFTSVNGVKAFFEMMKLKRIDIRSLSGCKLCAVGVATAGELNNHGLNVDYLPDKFTTRSLLDGMLEAVRPGEKVLLARAEAAGRELSEGLKQNGNEVVDLVVYRTLADTADRVDIIKLLEEKKIDFITFTSSSTVKNFVAVIGQENTDKISHAKVVCIGPVTAKTAADCGLDVTAVADVHTIDGIIDKLTEL